MRKPKLLPLLLSGLGGLVVSLPTPLIAAELTPDSRVTAVTVYRQQALVAREARLSLPTGDHRVILQGLPSVADRDSIRVAGSGSGGIEIGGVEVRQEFRQPDLSPEHRQLQAQLDDLTRQQALLDDRRKAISSLREFLASLKATAGQESSKDLLTRGFAVESWQKAFDFLSARFGALAQEEGGLEPRRKDLAEKMEVVRRRLAQLASQASIQRWSTSVQVRVTRSGEMTLRLTYLASGASWTPLYEARLDAATGEVRLSWQAQVTQSTDEDWRGVAVTLATTRPSAGIDLPKLASVHLRPGLPVARLAATEIEAMPVLGYDYQDVMKLAPGVTEPGAEAAPSPPSPAKIAQAEAARREVAVVFDLPGRLDVPSDGQPHKHLIASRDMKGTIEYYAVPRLTPAVYLVAKVTLPGEVPILPGRVQHFVGSDLVGSSWMAERAAGEEFSLSFGPDDRLKGERKQVRRAVDHKGKSDEIDYHFITTLENRLGRDVVIDLKDLIPVSGDERVVVELDDEATTPGFTTEPKEPGILTWKAAVANGGKREISLRYRVRSPAGLPIPLLD